MINATWHRAHPMPRNPSVEQRIAWHLEHARQCGCRDFPPKLRSEMEKRGIAVPRVKGR